MMNSAKNTESSRSQELFSWLWRIALLLLPWQTRWFTQPQRVFSFTDWSPIAIEHLRLSLYVSQIVLVVTIFVAFLAKGRALTLAKKEKIFVAIGSLGFLILGRFSFSPLLTLQWWVQTGLLGAFVFVLWRQSVPVKTFSKWVFLSLLPSLLSGVWQMLVQRISASKWLGIAVQNPVTSGVSVVGDQRWLRMYGIFPHPNIFAGWIVIVWLILLANWMREQKEQTKGQTILWWGMNILCGAALFLTYSRTAWLAMMVGSAVLFWNFHRDLWRFFLSVYRQRLIQILGFLSFCLAVFFLAWQWPQVRTRSTSANRLEKISLDERQQSLKQGWAIAQWPYSLVVGVGPGGYVKALELFSQENAATLSTGTSQMIPPHFVWLIAFAELGIPGSILLILFMRWVMRRHDWEKQHEARKTGIPILWAFLLLSCGDHYLWTLWPGKTLVAIGFAWILLSLDSPLSPVASYEQPV